MIINKYTAAVMYLADYIEATKNLVQNNKVLDGMEDELEYCLNVLRSNNEYKNEI